MRKSIWKIRAILKYGKAGSSLTKYKYEKAFLILSFITCTMANAQTERLICHDLTTDATGNIKPWYSDEPGKAWSHVIQLVWHFWDTMRVHFNGLPYYIESPGVAAG